MQIHSRCIVGLVVVGCLGVAGCVTLGRPIDRVVRSSDIPLVPVPPPPLGQGFGGKTSPTPAPAPTPRAPVPVTTESETPVVPVKDEKNATPRADSSKTTEIKTPAANNRPSPLAAPTTKQLIQAAQKRYSNLDSYIVRLTRREKVKDTTNPEEIMMFWFRKEPWSVRLKWLGKEGQGREVVFVKGKYEGKIHSKLAAGDIPFMPAGKRMALSVDNLLVKSATRHPITQAGLGASIERLAAIHAALERGDRKLGTLSVGVVTRPEYNKSMPAVEHTIPPNVDTTLPEGGKRTYFFDTDTDLPMLIRTVDEKGAEVEYYRHDRLQPEVKLDDADFDPDTLFGKPTPKPTTAKE